MRKIEAARSWPQSAEKLYHNATWHSVQVGTLTKKKFGAMMLLLKLLKNLPIVCRSGEDSVTVGDFE